jgi:hypothetical protein
MTSLSTLIHRFATPLTTGLFAVSTISGVALFFHWAPAAFHAMHEWLSVVLLLPFALHLWKNWRSLLGYAKRGYLVLPLLACLIVAAPFVASGLTGGSGGNPAMRTTTLMTSAPLSNLAPLLKTTPDALLATLRQQGYQAVSADQTLAAIAAVSGKSAAEALVVVLPAQ